MTVLVHSYSHLWAGDGGAWSRRAAVGPIQRLSRLLDVAFAIPGTQSVSASKRCCGRSQGAATSRL
jgi:hypothetical protein